MMMKWAIIAADRPVQKLKEKKRVVAKKKQNSKEQKIKEENGRKGREKGCFVGESSEEGQVVSEKPVKQAKTVRQTKT